MAARLCRAESEQEYFQFKLQIEHKSAIRVSRHHAEPTGPQRQLRQMRCRDPQHKYWSEPVCSEVKLLRANLRHRTCPP